MGNHTLANVMWAERPNVKHGAAISATAAGRTPLKKASTTGLLAIVVKNIATNKMQRKLGRITPDANAILPRIPFNL